jgi:rare lipoprotein A
MNRTLIRLVTASGMLALLAACGTAPRTESVEAAPIVRPALPPAAEVLRAASPSASPAAPENPPLELPADEPGPHLLGGELPKEYQRGGASWYGPRFHGRRTASGERYDMHDFTAAHRTLPFGTLVRVRSLVNGKEIDVRITDRGPFSHNRIIDVSRAAADELGMLTMGVKDVALFVPESTATPPDIPLRFARKINRSGRVR